MNFNLLRNMMLCFDKKCLFGCIQPLIKKILYKSVSTENFTSDSTAYGRLVTF
jgi:hypothetical protein